MAEQTLTLIDAILKNVYEGKIRDVLNNTAMLYKEVKKSNRPWSGRQVIYPVKIARNASSASAGLGASLPNPGRQIYAESRIAAKYHYATIRVDGQSMESTKGNAAAFAPALTSEISGCMTDFIQNQNRQFFGDGSGAIAVASGAFAGNDLVLTSGTQNILEEQEIEIWNAAGTVQRINGATTFVTVVSVDDASDTITFDGDLLLVANTDILVIRGSLNQEVDGLANIVRIDGTFQNINRTLDVNRKWRATTLAYGGALTEDLMQQSFDAINRASGQDPDWILASYATRRAYIATLTPQKRFVDMTLSGGVKKRTDGDQRSSGINFNEIPFQFEKDCPSSTIYFLKRSSIQCYELRALAWDNRDGHILQRTTGPRRDSYEANLIGYWNLGSDAPNCNHIATGTL